MENFIKQDIKDTLELNYMPYAMSVIVSRAIPEIDGFKPAHRKLLYTMFKMGLLKGNKIKSADIVGQTMRLNPHGDSAIYETLVRLTRGNAALIHPFIDSKGNFGKQYSRDMAYAASRYTEAKLDEFCKEIFKDIDKNTVDFIENYNGSTTEPLLLPTTFPNILITPNQGIAVGMASTICSFNLKEVCKTTIKFIDDENIDLFKSLKAPDFSTGGQLIYDKEALDKIYTTGRGSIKVQGKYTFDKKNNCIEITEIPYTTTIEQIIDKIITLVKDGKLKDVQDVRDETGLQGLKIAIDVKKNTNIDVLMHKLFTMTTLRDSFNCNFNILINGQPMTLGVRGILENWLDFRIGCIRRQTHFDIKKKKEKLDLLEGLSKIILDIDKAIEIIRRTENEKDVLPNLISYFKINEIQANFIAEIKLRNLNKEYLLNRIKEKDVLIDEIKNLELLYNSDDLIKEEIKTQLKEIIKVYGKPRLTEIIDDSDVVEIDEDDLVQDFGVKVFLTDHSYFKKITLFSLRSASNQNIKEDDEIVQEIETNNKSEMLFFTNQHSVYKTKLQDVTEVKASVLGDYLPNLLDMEEDESVLYMVNTIEYKGYMVFAFENGKVAKVTLDVYKTKVNRKKLINAFSNNDKVVKILYIENDCDIYLKRNDKKMMVINTSLIPLKATKTTIGVQVFRLKKDSFIYECDLIGNLEVEDKEYFRVSKIPTTGHFLMDFK
ncbi:MAG: DNA gyrase subunit A [Lachnospirales bacterium]